MPEQGWLYSAFPENLVRGNVGDLEGAHGAVMCALLSEDYSFDQHTDDSWHEVKGDEVSGAGYNAGGKALTGVSIARSEAQVIFDAADVQWENATIAPRWAVLYYEPPPEESPVDTDRKLIMVVDFLEVRPAYNGLFKIQWDPEGIFAMTAATPE